MSTLFVPQQTFGGQGNSWFAGQWQSPHGLMPAAFRIADPKTLDMIRFYCEEELETFLNEKAKEIR